MLRIRWSDRAVVRATGAMRSTRVRHLRTSLLGALVGVIALAFAANASALGPAVNIGNLQHGGPPAVAVDSAGNAQIAWADEVLPYTIHTCTLPVGATACSQTHVITPAGTEYIDGVKLLVDGSTIVLLADVYGHSEENEPEQEWTSTDGGASFNAVNEGKSVAYGILNADTGPLNAVIVPGTNALGYAWVTAGGPPTFAEFPLASPPTCSRAAGHHCPFATLQPEGSEHILSNPHGAFAAQSGSNSGVLGVYETLGPPGCPSGSFDTAFVYGSGEQGAGNSYNISPGKAGSAWRVGLSPGDCEVQYAAVGGGPSGFGVVEDNLAAGSTVYHRFDPTTNSFDTPLVTIAGEGEQSPSVNQDGAGGIYATYLAGFRGQVRLAYSSNGGSAWSGPATLDAAGGSALSSDVNAAGQGWATWQVGEAFYAQPFTAADALPPTPPPTPVTVTSSQTSGTTTGANISIPAGTVGETDQAILTGTHAATATGTVSYGLYDDSSCTKAVSSSSEAVTAGKPAASAPITTALSPGTYYWRVVYSGDALNDAGASACGSEVLTVASAPKAGEGATSTSTTVTVTITCSGPCTVTITITIPTASAARKSKKKPKPLILATGTFTIHKSGPQKLTLHLTKTGRKIFAARHGRLKASLLLSQKIGGHTISSTKTIKITPAKHKHK